MGDWVFPGTLHGPKPHQLPGSRCRCPGIQPQVYLRKRHGRTNELCTQWEESGFSGNTLQSTSLRGFGANRKWRTCLNTEFWLGRTRWMMKNKKFETAVVEVDVENSSDCILAIALIWTYIKLRLNKISWLIQECAQGEVLVVDLMHQWTYCRKCHFTFWIHQISQHLRFNPQLIMKPSDLQIL